PIWKTVIRARPATEPQRRRVSVELELNALGDLAPLGHVVADEATHRFAAELARLGAEVEQDLVDPFGLQRGRDRLAQWAHHLGRCAGRGEQREPGTEAHALAAALADGVHLGQGAGA